MDAVSDVPRRNLFARHLREVVDILELKVSATQCSPVGAADAFPDVFFVAIRATKSHPSMASSTLNTGPTLNRLFRILVKRTHYLNAAISNPVGGHAPRRRRYS